jgi:ABC-2 type transport system permease protein
VSQHLNGAAIVRLVAGRELRERSRQKSFKLSTAFIAVALLAAVIIPQLLADDESDSYDIGVVGAVPELVRSTIDGLAATTGSELSVVEVSDAGSGETRVTDGRLDLLVTGGEVVVDEQPDVSSTLGRVAGRLAEVLGLSAGFTEAGLSSEEAAEALGRGPVPVRSLGAADGETAASDGPQPLLILGVILLYLSLLTFGVAVTTGVVEEKTSRVVEVLLSAIRPHHLLAGKVLGIGVLGLAQLVMVATPALVVALATGTELPSGSLQTVQLVLWFVLGYALYSCAYAAAGSLISRMEEANNTSFPVTFALIAAYGGAIFVGNAPDSGAARLLALFPPTAPLAMPTRAALGNTAWWEVPLAVVLTLAATYGLVRLAGRIYAGSVLRFGPKVKLRHALR